MCVVGEQGNVKALLRKGTALLTMQEYADAIAALTQVRRKPNRHTNHPTAEPEQTTIGGKILCRSAVQIRSLRLCTALQEERSSRS